MVARVWPAAHGHDCGSRLLARSGTNWYSSPVREVKGSFIRRILAVAADPSVISFAGGLPCEECFPADAIRDALMRAMEDPVDALQYTVTAGVPKLREWIATRLQTVHKLRFKSDQILITTGSQQALDLIAKLFSDHPVFIEDPGYLGATQAFGANGIRPRIYPGLSNDLPVGSVVYSMTRFGNPTGRDRPAEETERLAGSLARRGLWLIEDDPYGEICFSESPPILASSLEPDRVIYLGSFSKSIAPSLRIGFMAAPDEIIGHLNHLKQAADLHSSGLLQIALHELVTNALSFDDHLAHVRETYRRKYDRMAGAIRKHLPQCDFNAVNGGMFIWGRLPAVNTEALFNRSIKRGVAFVPGRHFFLEPDGQDEFLRLNFSNSDEDDIDEGIRRIADSVNGT